MSTEEFECLTHKNAKLLLEDKLIDIKPPTKYNPKKQFFSPIKMIKKIANIMF